MDRDIAHLAVVLDYEAANSMASVQSLQTVLRAAYQAFAEQTGVAIQVVWLVFGSWCWGQIVDKTQ